MALLPMEYECRPDQGRSLSCEPGTPLKCRSGCCEGGEGGRQRQQPSDEGCVGSAADLRSECTVSAKRDRALGEELLDKLKLAKTQEASDPPHKGSGTGYSGSNRPTLSCARQLLDVDVARALQFADPALTNCDDAGTELFFHFLREKDPAAADRGIHACWRCGSDPRRMPIRSRCFRLTFSLPTSSSIRSQRRRHYFAMGRESRPRVLPNCGRVFSHRYTNTDAPARATRAGSDFVRH